MCESLLVLVYGWLLDELRFCIPSGFEVGSMDPLFEVNALLGLMTSPLELPKGRLGVALTQFGSSTVQLIDDWTKLNILGGPIMGRPLFSPPVQLPKSIILQSVQLTY
jgi:hypothetical protein